MNLQLLRLRREAHMIERSYRFEESVYEELKEIAQHENVTVAQLVRMAVSRFLKEYTESVDLMEIFIKD